LCISIEEIRIRKIMNKTERIDNEGGNERLRMEGKKER
jgi:hypothetical protein